MIKRRSIKQDLAYREVERVRVTSPIVNSYTSLQPNAQNKNTTKNKKVCMSNNWTFDNENSRECLYFDSGDSFKKVRGMINKMRDKIKHV